MHPSAIALKISKPEKSSIPSQASIIHRHLRKLLQLAYQNLRMLNPFYAFFKTRHSLGALSLRLALATIFGYYSGQKVFGLFDGPGFKETLQIMTDPNGLALPSAIATLAIAAELLIAICFIFGFLTRLTALLAISLMTASITLLHTGAPFSEIQLPILIIASSFSLLIGGGGSLSLDKAISSSLLPDVGNRPLKLTLP